MTPQTATHLRWDDVALEPMRGAITRKFVTTDKLMLAQITLKAGDSVPAHRHHNEQMTYVISGVMDFLFGDAQDQAVTVRAGEVVMIPGELLHSVTIPEDTFELDIFSPPREDWISGSDAYLRT